MTDLHTERLAALKIKLKAREHSLARGNVAFRQNVQAIRDEIARLESQISEGE